MPLIPNHPGHPWSSLVIPSHPQSSLVIPSHPFLSLVIPVIPSRTSSSESFLRIFSHPSRL